MKRTYGKESDRSHIRNKKGVSGELGHLRRRRSKKRVEKRAHALFVTHGFPTNRCPRLLWQWGRKNRGKKENGLTTPKGKVTKQPPETRGIIKMRRRNENEQKKQKIGLWSTERRREKGVGGGCKNRRRRFPNRAHVQKTGINREGVRTFQVTDLKHEM